MRRTGLIIALLLFGFAVLAQDYKNDKKSAKKALKEAKLQSAKESTAELIQLVESKKFIIQANNIVERNRNDLTRYNIYKFTNSLVLNPNLNFVAFDGDNSTVQLSFVGLVGENGVGGVTLDGKVTKMEIRPREDGVGFRVHAVVQNKLGSDFRIKGGRFITMLMRVYYDGTTRIDMEDNFGDHLSFQGYIMPLEESTVYKGIVRY